MVAVFVFIFFLFFSSSLLLFFSSSSNHLSFLFSILSLLQLFFGFLPLSLSLPPSPTLQNVKLVSQCIDAFDPVKSVGKVYNKGMILQCLNAVRLQASTLSPSTLLRCYLLSHDGWRRSSLSSVPGL